MLKVNMVFLGDEFLKGKDIVNEVIGESIIKGLEDKKGKNKASKNRI